MKISLCASAAKPEYWEHFYKSVGNPKVEFEFSFAGPHQIPHPSHQWKLPSNFRYIQTDVKPSQCFEIAARNSTGDLIMCCFDDAEFLEDGKLDRLVELWENEHNPCCMVTPRYKLNHTDYSHSAHKFFVQNQEGPTLPIAGVIGREFYFNTGGVDRNFVSVMWDVDLGMRSYQAGSRCVFSDVYINEIKTSPDSFSGEEWDWDRTFLNSMWSDKPDKYMVRTPRTQPVESFSQGDLTKVSEGKRWHKYA